MSAPTSYTEATLATYMHSVLGDVATTMGWSAGTASYGEAVNETLLAYGVDSISSISGRDGIAKLRALARVEAWRQVISNTAGGYDFSADGASYSRSQMHEQALASMRVAEADAMQYGGYGYEAIFQNLEHVQDPYAYIEDDDRVRDP